MSAEKDTRIVVGEIVGVFGVRGWVKLHSFTDPRTNIFGFDGDLRGRNVKLEWIARLRGEIKFAGVSELVAQLERDKVEASRILG